MPIDEMMIHFVPFLFCIDKILEEPEYCFYDEEDIYRFPPSLLNSFDSLGKSIYLMDMGTQLLLFINKE